MYDERKEIFEDNLYYPLDKDLDIDLVSPLAKKHLIQMIQDRKILKSHQLKLEDMTHLISHDRSVKE